MTFRLTHNSSFGFLNVSSPTGARRIRTSCNPSSIILKSGDPVPGVEDLGLLTHLPIQNADTRLAVPITDILEAPDQDIRYLTDTSPKPWVENEVDRQGYRLLERPNSGAFSVLTQALDLEPVDADRPIIPTNELNIASDVLTRDLKQELHDRVDFIVAALEMTDCHRAISDTRAGS